MADLSQEPFCVVPAESPDGAAGTVHLSISDASGDSAYDQQLALDAYWREIGGLTMVPATNRAADRFARPSFYIDTLPKDVDDATARSRTRRTCAITSNSTRSPNVFWLDLAGLDFSEGAPVLRLMLTDGSLYAGNAADQLEPTDPYAFLEAAPD